MTIAPDAAAIHDLVDRIDPADYSMAYALLRRLTADGPIPLRLEALPASTVEPAPPGRRFSFTAVGEGPGDLSERAKDYLRESYAEGSDTA
ncbi:hypothetical protein [Streptomyces sp. NPDC097619]|uniref:hypothetical protein n=1 Tax=Streptomyces sp. NPDC097619 TaxID=3157228 RepID=UPI00331CFCC9